MARRLRCGTSELCTMFASEWRADSQALAADGQYWRSVFGGARLVLGCVRCSPFFFAALRVLLTACTFAILFVEVSRISYPVPAIAVPPGVPQITSPVAQWFLYFSHWTLALQCFYFTMASLLTLFSVCTAGTGGIARTTPFLVRITELAYGCLLPAVLTNFLVDFTVIYAHQKDCLSYGLKGSGADPLTTAILSGSMLGCVYLDYAFCRQPYYASFHAILGIIFCWAWVLFDLIPQLFFDVHTILGTDYIYKCLDWEVTTAATLTGKIITINWFATVPLFNYLYWLLIWGRRRTLTIYKKGPEPLSMPLTATPRPPTARRVLFEYTSDYRDLALDGRHWRAQFGGSSSPRAPKMGAYICCSATIYPWFRLLLAAIAIACMSLRMTDFTAVAAAIATSSSSPSPPAAPPPSAPYHATAYLFLYFENWVLLLACVYFGLAFLLTFFASCTPGRESTGTPIIIWLTWACYGALLPAAMCNVVIFLFLKDDFTIEGVNTRLAAISDGTLPDSDMIFIAVDLIAVFGVLVLAILDAWVNRQPYYATYHAFIGAAFCWIYLIFNAAYVLAGGLNEDGQPYIYPSLNWKTATDVSTFMSAGKVLMLWFFLVIPVFNALYWCMLWARRRARVAAKQGV